MGISPPHFASPLLLLSPFCRTCLKQVVKSVSECLSLSVRDWVFGCREASQNPVPVCSVVRWSGSLHVFPCFLWNNCPTFCCTKLVILSISLIVWHESPPPPSFLPSLLQVFTTSTASPHHLHHFSCSRRFVFFFFSPPLSRTFSYHVQNQELYRTLTRGGKQGSIVGDGQCLCGLFSPGG